MLKKYEIKAPKSTYFSIFYIAFLLITHVLLNIILVKNLPLILQIYNWFAVLIVIVLIVWQIILISRLGKVLEITKNSIKTERIELPTNKIAKIFVHGYFIRSIVVKRVGQRFFSPTIHFQFKNDEENHLKEMEQWAELNNIPFLYK